MIKTERENFHKQRAHAYIKAAIRELVQVSSLDRVHARVLRELNRMEDVLWQMEEKKEAQ